MKSLSFGALLIIIIGLGGLLYRNAIEYSTQPIACPLDTFVCPDGTRVSRTGVSCGFPACPPPNVTLSDVGISFALPEGFTASTLTDAPSVAAYEPSIASVAEVSGMIIIRRYAINASSTALATIQLTAVNGASGAPVNPTSFSSTVLGNHRFTVVSIERFEGVIDTAYYLARGSDVLRFDAIDQGVDWTNPNLDVSTLQVHQALTKLLGTLQGE